MDFWRIIQKFLNKEDIEDHTDASIIEYDSDMLKLYNYVIAAYTQVNTGDLIISFFKPEQWEMVLSTAELLDIQVEDVVRDLTPDEIKQLIIPVEDWNTEDDRDNFF